ncbi:phage tail sheath C-terminal domain-containing protein [Maledivibacter halophilus]|uniref:Phage tail sheath protein n=1 Tax=Maledivibacter halophilus TaxID=36842 RepID=A0A1T5M3W4_9FIRM|nr:phage tail sheath C-terminal domain-containing protein [Maledivibacter halophilus]SKC82937.1 Phage tail sheath protein [Maledivibacter halophilus]
MGLPEILINFKTQGTTAIDRSARGIVALILKDDTKDFDTKLYKSVQEVDSEDWTEENKDYIEKTFMGTPREVIVERIAKADTDYSKALARLKNKKWNYLAVPGIEEGNTENIVSWIKTERDTNKKTYKAVLPNAAGDHEGIINFTTESIKVKDKIYSAGQYTGRIAGILAGLPFTRSATYYQLSEVEAVTASTDPDADIDGGKLILVNDGTKIKIGRGVNSLTSLDGAKGEEFKKIKIVDAVDLMRDDIRNTFDGSYVGKITNSYDHKVLFLSAVNAYFEELERLEVLDSAYDNKAQIDIQTQRTYLLSRGVDVDSLKPQEIKEYNTGSKVFATAKVKFLDAMEDLQMEIYM